MARRRISNANLVWGGSVLVLVVAVVVSLVGAPGDAPTRTQTGPAPPCPFGYVDRPAIGAALMARLRTTTDGGPLLAALGETEVRFCFSEQARGYVTEGRVLLLDPREPDPELAARTGHLLHHVVQGMPFPESLAPDADCDEVLREAVAREASAYAVEVRLRRALGQTQPRYEFEPGLLRGSAEEGERSIADYLWAHPDGAPNLDGLVAGYRDRCERETGGRAAGRPRDPSP